MHCAGAIRVVHFCVVGPHRRHYVNARALFYKYTTAQRPVATNAPASFVMLAFEKFAEHMLLSARSTFRPVLGRFSDGFRIGFRWVSRVSHCVFVGFVMVYVVMHIRMVL